MTSVSSMPSDDACSSIQIGPALYLVHQRSPITRSPAPDHVNHIAVIDCSGSMHGTLPALRASLKRKLPSLLKQGDTLSLLWFSGRGELGVLLEGETVETLKDLARVNAVIDRWLMPVGLTGFKEPIEAARAVVARVAKQSPHPFSLFFMSDGQDNQWTRAEILRAVASLSEHLVASAFVEYGYYADRPMLAAMAAEAGGQLIFADAFERYEPTFESALSRRVISRARRMVELPGVAPVGGFAFSIDRAIARESSALTTYAVVSRECTVPDGVEDLFWIASEPVGMLHVNSQSPTGDRLRKAYWTVLYAALSLFAVRMQSDVVFPILRALGDVRFIRAYATCFGKQQYSKFMEMAKQAVFDEQMRMVDGHDPDLVPPDDAFTVLDLLQILEADDARIFLDSPALVYNRISRKMLNAEEHLSAREQAQLADLSDAMKKTKSVDKLKELQGQIDAILASKRKALVFTQDGVAPSTPNELLSDPGYEIASLTHNETSPNISVLVRKDGSVSGISERMPDAIRQGPLGQELATQQDRFPTFLYRNYAIVAHGIVHIDQLPVQVTKATYEKLKERISAPMLDSFEDAAGKVTTFLPLGDLPILNRKTVTRVSLIDAVKLKHALTRRRAWVKVFKDIVKTRYPGEKLVGFTARYGEEAAGWLKEACGITEYGGFNPPKVQAESTDFIMGRELEIKLKGFSSLPTVKLVHEKLGKSAKLNGPEAMMAEAIREIDSYTTASPGKLHRAWILGKLKTYEAEARALSHQMAKITFSIIVGQVWFSDASSAEDDTRTLEIDGRSVIGTAVLSEVQIKV